MTKRFMILAATAAMALSFSTRMFAAVDEELVLSDGADIVTIDVSNLGVLTVTCTLGNCGNVAAKTTSDGVDGTISITHATFGAGGKFTISDTAQGGADSTLPTLMDLNQIDATSAVAGALLTSTFTDTGYTDLSPLIKVQDSIVPDTSEDTSTVTFNVSTGTGVPASTLISTNTLSGGAVGNGGATVVNPNHPNGNVTAQAILNFVTNGSIQANVSVSNVAVPEPASTVLLGTMILGLTALIRKKKQAKRS